MSYEGLKLWGARFVVFYQGLKLWEARFVVFYKGLRLWEAHLYVFYVSGRLSGGRMSNDAVKPRGSAKERPSRAWGEGEWLGGAGIIMSSSDVGSYEFTRAPCEMQMEERSAHLARSTSDRSADIV